MSESLYYENEHLWSAERYALDPAQVARFETCLEMLPGDATSLLDAGCGNGQFLHWVEEHRPGVQVRGVERSRAAIAARVCRAPIDEASVDTLPYPDASFDVVSAQEVIEHLPYGVYEAALREMGRVAREYLLISVPFREPRVVATCPNCGCSFNPHYHMRSYARAGMEGLVPGFRLVRFEGVWTRKHYLFGTALRRMRGASFPWHARCPLCGFQREQTSQGGAPPYRPAAEAGDGVTGIFKRFWPATRTARWAVALYRRADRVAPGETLHG